MLKKIFQNKGKSVLDSFADNHSPTPSPGIGTGGGLSAGLKDKSDSKVKKFFNGKMWDLILLALRDQFE